MNERRSHKKPQEGPTSPLLMKYGEMYENNKNIGAGDDQDIAFPDNKSAKAPPRLLDRIGFWVLTFVFCVFSVAMVLLFAVVFGSLWVDQDKRITELRKEIIQLIAESEARVCEKIEAVANRTRRIERVLAKGPFQPLREKAEPDGYAPLDGEAIVPDEHLPAKLLNAMFLGNEGGGCWDPRINEPLLKSNQACEIGEYYISNNTGTSILDTFGGVNDPWQVGDGLVCTGDIGWKRVRDIPRVKTWNGMTGDILAFLGSLINVDETGANTGDALVLFFDDIWRPAECCSAAVGHQPGFLARFVGRQDPDGLDDSDSVQFRGQTVLSQRWTDVSFAPTPVFPFAVFSPNGDGARWSSADPNFFFQNTDVLRCPYLGTVSTYTVPETGWYHTQSRIRIDPGSVPDFFAMRLFRSNVGQETIYTKTSTFVPDKFTGLANVNAGVFENNILSLDGTFAFCEGEELQIQYYEFRDDDDEFNCGSKVQFDLVEDMRGPYNVTGDPDYSDDGDPGGIITPTLGRYLPTGGMFWSMWKVPDILMPKITSCRGFELKKREARDHNRVYQTEWEDPELTYRLKMHQWERNTAFYNHQCGVAINCTHYKPGPEPEMPSFMKPPPPPPPAPATPPDSGK